MTNHERATAASVSTHVSVAAALPGRRGSGDVRRQGPSASAALNLTDAQLLGLFHQKQPQLALSTLRRLYHHFPPSQLRTSHHTDSSRPLAIVFRAPTKFDSEHPALGLSLFPSFRFARPGLTTSRPSCRAAVSCRPSDPPNASQRTSCGGLGSGSHRHYINGCFCECLPFVRPPRPAFHVIASVLFPVGVVAGVASDCP